MKLFRDLQNNQLSGTISASIGALTNAWWMCVAIIFIVGFCFIDSLTRVAKGFER